MARRQSHRRSCVQPGCGETSFVEYTSRWELEGVSSAWKCARHREPDRVLSAENRETTAVLTLHPSYVQSTSSWSNGSPQLVGYFWGPESADRGSSGVESGPGFMAYAKDFPPGTRLVVTARIEIPPQSTGDGEG